jgi:hypothetical protein
MQSISRSSLTLVALFAVGCAMVFGYSFATRIPSLPGTSNSSVPMPTSDVPASDVPTPPTPAAIPTIVTADAEPAPQPRSDSASTTATQAVAPQTVVRWIAEATGHDAPKRAAAITALGKAPKLQALPVLERVVNAGESEEDRQLALASLRTLAQDQGDADGSIRKAVRDAIYHGDNEVVTREAQNTLGEIESSLAKAPNTPP